MRDKTQFYIIESSDNGREVFATNIEYSEGMTFNYAPSHGQTAVCCEVIAGPFTLPEPMPHVLAVERWLRLCSSDLYDEYFDTDNEEITEKLDGNLLCEVCHKWFEPNTPNFESTEFGTFNYFQHTDRLCSESCLQNYVFGYRSGSRSNERVSADD